MVTLGLGIAFLSMIMAVFTLIKWISGQIHVIGYASLMISIWFLSGSLLITLGLVGLYIGKTFEGVKNRPLYIVDKIVSEKK
jgi:dolichol-phosphate mannosyltransferase